MRSNSRPGTPVPRSITCVSTCTSSYRSTTFAPHGSTGCATPSVFGVAHPVLPCGAKVVLRYEDVQVLTQVIDRGTGVPGREFDLTAALARRIGLDGVQPIRWRFAAVP